MEIVDHGVFRVTRDADFTVSDEADDLLRAVEAELRRRRFGEVVRVEVDAGMSPRAARAAHRARSRSRSAHVFDVDGLLDLNDLWQIVKLPGFGELRDPPWTPVTQPRLQRDEDDGTPTCSRVDARGRHPRPPPLRLVRDARSSASSSRRSTTPTCSRSSMTVYRTSDDSPLVPALIRAAERGKQAVCLVELKARFDERANISWARALEEAGVHVVYGLPALKTHAKCLLVVRREGDGVRHYVHVGTGNYHPKTARLYTDFGLFTCDEQIGADVADMFNFLTGFARPRRYRKVLVAPDSPARRRSSTRSSARSPRTRRASRARIAHEDELARRPRAASRRSTARRRPACRSTSTSAASAACGPGVPGVSENIRVVSVVGRFLEHSRIYALRARRRARRSTSARPT